MNQTLVEMLKALNEKDLKEMNSANKELHSIIEILVQLNQPMLYLQTLDLLNLLHK